MYQEEIGYILGGLWMLAQNTVLNFKKSLYSNIHSTLNLLAFDRPDCCTLCGSLAFELVILTTVPFVGNKVNNKTAFSSSGCLSYSE